MKLKNMRLFYGIVGILSLIIWFLILFWVCKYSNLNEMFNLLLLIFSSLTMLFIFSNLEMLFCKKGIKKFESMLVDKNIRKKLVNYFLKENFVRKKYNNDDDIDFYENKERNNIFFRSFVTDLKLVDNSQLESNLVALFQKLIEESSILEDSDGYFLSHRNFVFLITDKYDEEIFKILDSYTFIKQLKIRHTEMPNMGSFVIPIVLCTEDHSIYFTNPSRYPFFFEERKLDVLKLFEIDSK